MTPGPLTQMLHSRRPLLLDGAMGTELQRRGATVALPLWSAHALLDDPALVTRIHSDYIAAGADIITTNTFRTTRRTFRRARMEDRSLTLTQKAVDLACRARDASGGREILIAASIGPLEDCYRPDLVPSDRELEEEHGEQAARLAGTGADFLLLETIGSVREAEAACRAARGTGREYVVSFLCTREGALYSGEPMSAALAAVVPHGPAVISLNCIPAREAGTVLGGLARATSLPLGIYANVGLTGGERDGVFVRDVDEEEYRWCGLEWLALGASIVGGCCGTTPEYIGCLAEAFTDGGSVRGARR